MIKWVVRIWVGLAIILPALLGLAMMFGLMPPGMTVARAASMTGLRNVVAGGVVLAAALLLDPKAVGVLLIGRGATDLLDSLTGLASGEAIATAMAPLILSIISFVVAYLILRDPNTAIFARTPTSQRKGR